MGILHRSDDGRTSQYRQKFLKCAGGLCLFAGLLCLALPADSQSSFGTITGLIKDATQLPIRGATITAVKVDGSTIRSTISSSEGLYSFPDLPPGTWSISVQSQGYPEPAPSTLQVTIGRATRADLAMTVAVNAASPKAVVLPSPVLASLPAVPPATQLPSAPILDVAAASASSPSTPSTAPQAALIPVSAAGTGSSVSTYGPSETRVTKTDPNNFWRRWLNGDGPTMRELAAQNSRRANPLRTASLKLPNHSLAGGTPASGAPVEPDAAPVAVDPNQKIAPFSDWDWTWLNGNTRQKDSPLDGKYFSGEFRADTHYGVDFNQPVDHTMGGSSELFRSGEVQMEELALGGDFHIDNVRGRVLFLTGLFSTTTPRNDASAAVGQWDVRNAYRYVSEAYGGYHFNVNYGLNVDAGIFVSYVGLFSYHNFDNWAYQPSYVSSNTPWFFNGVRVQWFPTAHLKIEPWFINGWQSYNKFNSHPGLGGQLKWTPKPWLVFIANQYGYGEDTLYVRNRQRYHTDDSIEVKYYDNPHKTLDKAAFTFTGDLGCESGGGVSCTGKGAPKQAFLGYMLYNRFWFQNDKYGLTLGGGAISNPGRYLTLVLPVNGADAISGTPYFPGNPGTQFKAYDATATFDYMPKQYFTFRTEIGYRHANVPYFSGRGGITPPIGNNGFPAQYVCKDGVPSATGACTSDGGLWTPDLRRSQALLLFAFMVKF